MKQIILIFCISISITVFGQEFPPKQIEQFDFTEIESEITDEEKLSLLQRIVPTEYFTPLFIEHPEDYEYAKYHVLDFNGDGLLDVIYDGRNPGGIETNNIAFFLNQDDSLKVVVKLNGDFTEITIEDNLLKGFQLIISPCCANYIYSIVDCQFGNGADCLIPNNDNHGNYKYTNGQVNESEYCVSVIRGYAYIMKTEFPAEANLYDSLILSEKTFLTPKPSEPTSTDFDEDGLSFHFNENKAISELPKGMACHVLSEIKDENGRTYCFVILKNKSEINNYVWRTDFEQYGWIEKSGLK